MGGVADLTVNGTAGWLYDTPTGSGLGLFLLPRARGKCGSLIKVRAIGLGGVQRYPACYCDFNHK